MITEDQLEQLCLDGFREGGYEYANGYVIPHGEVNGEARESALEYKEMPVPLDWVPFSKQCTRRSPQ